MYQYSGMVALFAKDYILRRWKAFVWYLMLHIHVWCGCGKLSRKKYPYYIAVGYGVGQAPRLLCEWVLFMYDSFLFLHFYYAGSVCQMFRAQVRWLLGCPCHSQAGECIPVILNKHTISHCLMYIYRLSMILSISEIHIGNLLHDSVCLRIISGRWYKYFLLG